MCEDDLIEFRIRHEISIPVNELLNLIPLILLPPTLCILLLQIHRDASGLHCGTFESSCEPRIHSIIFVILVVADDVALEHQLIDHMVPIIHLLLLLQGSSAHARPSTTYQRIPILLIRVIERSIAMFP